MSIKIFVTHTHTHTNCDLSRLLQKAKLAESRTILEINMFNGWILSLHHEEVTLVSQIV